VAYGLVLPIACAILVVVYVALADVPVAAKCVVGAAGIAAFMISWSIAAILLKLVVSLYVIFHFRLFRAR
jgi:hypothetical protein